MKNIEAFKTPQTISAAFTHRGAEYRVVIATPDLRAVTSSCWGDWGPMYTFRLENRETIGFCYSVPQRNGFFETTNQPSTLSLNSPMLAALRARYPFCLELRDEEGGVGFSVYFSPYATVSHVEVRVTAAERFEAKVKGARSAGEQLSA